MVLKRGNFRDIKFRVFNRLREMISNFFTPRALLKENINKMEAEKKVLERHYEDVNRLNRELNKKMKQILATQETAKAILSELNLEGLLSKIMNILIDVCKINRAIIMLRNEKSGFLEYLYGTDLKGVSLDDIKHYKVSLRRSNNILVRVSDTGIAEYIPDIEDSTLRKDNLLLTYTNPSAVYILPLITRAKVIGVIATDATKGQDVPEETRMMLNVFAPQIAIAIENARLYRKLQDQMQEIERSRTMLSRADKFSFLSNLSERLAHEIKDPISTIGDYIGMLPDRFDDEDFRDSLYSMALKETNRVNDLISELLSLVKTKQPEIKLIDLHDLIEKVVLLVSPHSNAKRMKIILRFDSDITYVWMDPEKIKQVILNILYNAVEFTPANGKIEVTTKQIMEHSKQYIKIIIKDNGIGMNDSLLGKIFDPYFSTKDNGKKQYGSGLGLFVAHQTVQDHQGIIKVKSKENEGSTFIISLPSDPP